MQQQDSISTVYSLARQYLMLSEGDGDITLPKTTLRILLGAYGSIWQTQQDNTRHSFPKVTKQ